MMVKKAEIVDIKAKVRNILRECSYSISENEFQMMDIADFGLSDIYNEGAEIISLLDTEKLALRLLVLLPWQTEPEHWHESVGEILGKEETLRVVSGELLVFIEGEDNMKLGKIPEKNAEYYTCKNEILLKQNEYITFIPGEKHWFQAMEKPVAFLSISTTAIDAKDPFTNKNIVRTTVIED